MSKKPATGVQEWATKSVNLQYGCFNNCVYCYSKKMAVRYNRIPLNGWDHPILKEKQPILPQNTRVMFPSTHDIFSNNLKLSIQCINLLLARGNEVLVVSKPRLDCIRSIINTNEIFNRKQHLEFRFTIGSLNNETLKFWEPNAPEFEERFACLQLGLQHGFKCSVSCEPLLDTNNHLIDYLLQYPKIDSIWIGAMNYTKDPPKLDYEAIYAKYKDQPQIKWKDSFRKHLERSI
jgi:DNA repair photolyase